MIKTILVCTDGSELGTVACRYGIHLAQQLQASLSGLHVLDSRMLEGPLMADISGWIGAQPYGAQLQQFRELMQQKGESIIEAFNELCEEAGVKAESWLKMGHPSRVIIEEEAKAELVVIGQKGEHADLVGDMLGSNAERISRNSIKPCLVVGSSFQPVKKILAAYDGSGHASQALHEAIELAQGLPAELVVVTVAEHGSREDAERISEDGRRLAEAHNCQAQPMVLDGNPDDVLLEQAAAQGCDLIVVGAHGHGRIREMFLGSTTTYLITRSNLPVMLVR